MKKWQKFKKDTFVTYILLSINIAVYIYTILKFGTSENSIVLLKMGANYSPLILIESQWYRLLTAAFLHIGFEHILFNGISLYFLGRDLEKTLGHWRYLFVYLIGAIGGNLASMAFNLNISAGASTGIFALFASYIVMGRLNPDTPSLSYRASSYSLLLLLQFVNSLFSSGIDNWGHFGGVIYGGLATLMVGYTSRYNFKNQYRMYAMIGMIALTMILILFGKFILLR